MNRRIIFATALLLLPLASAQPNGPIFVAQVAVDGESKLVSETFFANFVGGTAENRGLYVVAEHLRVELDHDSEIVTILADRNYNQTSRLLYEGSGRLVADEVRPGHRFVGVSDEATTTISSNGFKIMPKQGEDVSRSYGAASSRPKEQHVMGPMFEVDEAEGILRVQGSFNFTIYEWDGFVEHAGGRDAFWTGERYAHPHPLLEEHGVNQGGETEWQVAYVEVENGILEVDLRVNDASDIYIGSATGTLGGHIELTLPGEAKDRRNYNGPYGARVEAPEAGKVTVALSEPASATAPGSASTPVSGEPAVPGTGDPGRLAGVAPATTSPTLPGSDLPAWTYLLALPALLLFTGGVAYVRPIRRMHKLEDAYDLGIHAYVVDNAPPLLRSRRFGVQASLMYTVALLEERGPDEAEAHLSEVRPRSRPTGATHEYLLARIRAAQTRFDEARRHVHACLEAEPAFVMEIRRNASMEFLMRPPSDPGEGYA